MTRYSLLQCPFCGSDPKDIDITCCDLGTAYFFGRTDVVTISRQEFEAIADQLRDMRRALTDGIKP